MSTRSVGLRDVVYDLGRIAGVLAVGCLLVVAAALFLAFAICYGIFRLAVFVAFRD